MVLICFFVPKKSNSSLYLSVHNIKELVQMLMKLFDSFTESEPYDLVNLTADKIKVSIKIR